jgi:peptidoglycan/LPS O-acetylase OafA/YrhL
MLIPITALVIFSPLIAGWSVIAAFQRMLLQFAACFGRLQDAARGSAGTGFDPRKSSALGATRTTRRADWPYAGSAQSGARAMITVALRSGGTDENPNAGLDRNPDGSCAPGSALGPGAAVVRTNSSGGDPHLHHGPGAGLVSGLLSLSPAVFLGEISYSIYILHSPIAFLVLYQVPGPYAGRLRARGLCRRHHPRFRADLGPSRAARSKGHPASAEW